MAMPCTPRLPATRLAPLSHIRVDTTQSAYYIDRGSRTGGKEIMTTVSYLGFVLKIDNTTGQGQVRRGVSVAAATWDGFTLECAAIPSEARFELEIALICA